MAGKGLATRGTLVLYGQSSGPVDPFDPARLSGLTGTGRGTGPLTLSWVSAGHYLASRDERARAFGAVLGEVAAGRFSPRIAERFPLRHAREAHARLASRTVLGKILLQALTAAVDAPCGAPGGTPCDPACSEHRHPPFSALAALVTSTTRPARSP